MLDSVTLLLLLVLLKVQRIDLLNIIRLRPNGQSVFIFVRAIWAGYKHRSLVLIDLKIIKLVHLHFLMLSLVRLEL